MTMTRQGNGNRRSADDIKKAREEAEKKMHAKGRYPRKIDFYIRLTDHKKVGGLTLRTSSVLAGEEVSEEFEISKYEWILIQSRPLRKH